MSPALPTGLVRAALRVAGPAALSPAVPLRVRRRLADAAGRPLRPPAGVTFSEDRVGGVPGAWATPAGHRDGAAILYLHGGGYVLGSWRSHRAPVARLARRAGVRVFAADYRLAPEHPHPAALHDVLAAFDALAREGAVAIAGDSAGGGLALAAALALRDRGGPQPVALGLVCPWLDLAPDVAGERADDPRDPLLRARYLAGWARAYAAGHEASDEPLSPLNGDLAGLPPIVLHAAGDDPLAPDAERLAERAAAAGCSIEHRRHPGLWHDFHVHAGSLAAADAAVDRLGGALARHLTGRAPLRVAIVGAGMSGLCMLHTLRAAGHEDVVVYEKASELGGTWRENRYPGLTCDVPSRFYSYSFAPNPGWSRAFAPGREIQAYFLRTAERLGLRPHLRLGAEVTDANWQDGRWQLRTVAGEEDVADVLVTATGVLHHPKLPAIPGLDTFAGTAVHSARWDPSLDLSGKRVGVVGTGSTGVQITAALAGRVGHFTLFQRTAQWVLPVPNRRYLRSTRWVFRRVPALSGLAHRGYQALLEAILGVAVVRPGWQRTAVSALARANLRVMVRDRDLRRRLTPDYAPLCKRLVMSAGFYPALQRDRAELVTEAIARVEPRGVVTADGRLHELDVLILATGFDAHAYLRPMRVTGEDGVTLEQAWAAGPRAYRTVALPGFPNLFTLMGPHSPVGNQSLIAVAEAQAGYVLRWIERLERQGGHASPRADATDAYNAALREAAPRTIWASGCTSWYLDADGVPEVWPWTPARHRAMLREPEPGDFVVAAAPSAEP